MSQTNICVICAWRETCQKRFSVSGKDMRCAEFVRDVSIKVKETEAGESDEAEKEAQNLRRCGKPPLNGR